MTRSSVFFIVISTAAALVFIKLGLWQLERLRWKEGILHTMESSFTKEFSLTETLANLDQAEYVRLSVEGHYEERPVFLMPGKTHRGVLGSYLLMPFVTSQGIIMVNRGWIEADSYKEYTLNPALYNGVLLSWASGRIRLPQTPGPFTPDSEAEKHQLYHYDLKMLEQGVGQPLLPLVIEQELLQLPGPLGFEDRLPEIPNNHFQYALTWFAFAGITVIMTGVYAYRKRRES